MNIRNPTIVSCAVALFVALAWLVWFEGQDSDTMQQSAPGRTNLESKQQVREGDAPDRSLEAARDTVGRTATPAPGHDTAGAAERSQANADPETVFGRVTSRKILAYTGIRLGEYILATQDPEAVVDAANGYLQEMDQSWSKLNEVVNGIHAERLASGDYQTLGGEEQLLPSAEGIYVKSTLVWDATRQEDVRRVTTIVWNQDPALRRAHEELLNLKSGLRAVLLTQLTPKIAGEAGDRR